MKIVVLWFSEFGWVLLSREKENKEGKSNGKEGICKKEVGQVKGKNIGWLFGAEKPEAASPHHFIRMTVLHSGPFLVSRHDRQ